MENKNLTIDELKEFEILNIGMMNKIRGGCGSSDADRLCSSLCPTAGCKHDGCCAGYWDSWGDSACKGSGQEVAIDQLYKIVVESPNNNNTQILPQTLISVPPQYSKV